MVGEMGHRTMVSDTELKCLLVELHDKRPDICMRYRFIGEMWQPNFLRIMRVYEKGAALHDEITNRLTFIRDLASIMQFEIDAKFQNFQPHFHYEVQPLLKALF
jgi:hypothetical protein